jgi:rubrerythrin
VPAPEPAKPAGPSITDAQDRETKRRIRELKRKERHGDMTEKEEDELAHLEAQLEGGAAPVPTKCPKCGEAIEPDFIKCPSCNALLKK